MIRGAGGQNDRSNYVPRDPASGTRGQGPSGYPSERVHGHKLPDGYPSVREKLPSVRERDERKVDQTLSGYDSERGRDQSEKGKRVSASNPTTSVAYKEESNAKLTKGQAKIVL